MNLNTQTEQYRTVENCCDVDDCHWPLLISWNYRKRNVTVSLCVDLHVLQRRRQSFLSHVGIFQDKVGHEKYREARLYGAVF